MVFFRSFPLKFKLPSLSALLSPRLEGKVLPSRLTTAIGIPFGIALALFILNARDLLLVYFGFESSLLEKVSLEKLADELLYLNEDLHGDVFDAILGTKPGSRDNYQNKRDNLIKKLREIQELDPDLYEAYLTTVEAAFARMEVLEKEVLGLALAGQKEEALQLLESPRYLEVEQTYSEGLRQAIESLGRRAQEEQKLYREEIFEVLVRYGFSVAILLIAGMAVLLLIRSFALEHNATYERQLSDTRIAEYLAQIQQTKQEEDFKKLLTQILQEVRQRYGAERAALYRLTAADQAQVIAESREASLPSTLDVLLHPIPAPIQSLLQAGQVYAFASLPDPELGAEYLQLLGTTQIKAEMIAPLRAGEGLHGFLALGRVRGQGWPEAEQENFLDLATRLGLLLQERERAERTQKELLQLINDVTGAAQGDLTVRAQLTADEVGIVADFFNVIIENLRDIVIQVQNAVIQLNESIGRDETTARTLARLARRQATQAEKTLRSIDEVARSIQEVASKAQEAATVAEAAAETATAGGSTMDRTVQHILQLRETVAETAKKVKRLGESSQQISKVVSLIDQIALKTNLLAVNASIEAARAGEEGRGFAVVAEEVGALAAQSAEATHEIERIVEVIQRETREVVQAMETSTGQVVEGAHLVEAAKQNLEQIVEVARQVNQLFQGIARATEEQAAASHRGRQLMQNIADTATHTATAFEEVTQSLQATVAVARQLQASVSTFKVG